MRYAIISAGFLLLTLFTLQVAGIKLPMSNLHNNETLSIGGDREPLFNYPYNFHVPIPNHISTNDPYTLHDLYSNQNSISSKKDADEIWEIEWQRCLGGNYTDKGYTIRETNDGGYIICGESSSSDYDFIDNKGDYDIWVAKLSKSGTIEWKKNLGGNSEDKARDIILT